MNDNIGRQEFVGVLEGRYGLEVGPDFQQLLRRRDDGIMVPFATLRRELLLLVEDRRVALEQEAGAAAAAAAAAASEEDSYEAAMAAATARGTARAMALKHNDSSCDIFQLGSDTSGGPVVMPVLRDGGLGPVAAGEAARASNAVPSVGAGGAVAEAAAAGASASASPSGARPVQRDVVGWSTAQGTGEDASEGRPVAREVFVDSGRDILGWSSASRADERTPQQKMKMRHLKSHDVLNWSSTPSPSEVVRKHGPRDIAEERRDSPHFPWGSDFDMEMDINPHRLQ